MPRRMRRKQHWRSFAPTPVTRVWLNGRQRVALAGERTAAKKAREIEKAERNAHDAELAMEAKRAADAQAERALAETASRELALQTERKAARDARYAARKARSKHR